MQELIVGISGINAVDNPGPGVGVARALKEDPELKLRIVGLAYDAMEPGIYLDWLIDKTYLMPYPSSGRDAFLERIRSIKEMYGLDFIIPNLDAELPLYIKYEETLAEMGIRTFLPGQAQYRLRGKDKLLAVADKMKIELPETRVINSQAELGPAMEALGWPLMVKGVFYKAYMAHNSQQVMNYFNQLVAEWGYPVILQRVVSGEEMNVIGVGDGEGGLLGQVGIKKLWTTSLGKIWTGVTIKNPTMLDAAKNFVHAYKWKGPYELECKVEGDRVYLIEINPRFPAWSYFAAGVGMNLPSQMLRKAFDIPLAEVNDYEAGKLYIRYTYETITDMTAFRNMMTRGEN
ncbi:MAG: ATP-grasp domain-containing protein [Calditrichia bacterium]